MSEIINDFFNIIGADTAIPATMGELIPYLLHVFIGLVLVVAVFAVIGGIVRAVFYSIRRL